MKSKLYSPPDGLVPCSDISGTIAALSPEASAKGWKVGDKVSANFANDHLFGDPTPDGFKSVLGSGEKYGGALVKYKNFPEHVSVILALGEGYSVESEGC